MEDMKNFSQTFKTKKLVMFDIDGTIAESKRPIDKEMSNLLARASHTRKIAFISGEKYSQFMNQIVSKLPKKGTKYENVLLFPQNASLCYAYIKKEWKKVYEKKMTQKEEKFIKKTIVSAMKDSGFKTPVNSYGKLIENRGSEVVFSALGQKAPIAKKKNWNKNEGDIRKKIKNLLERRLPDFDAKIAGLTSIDVIREGINKSFGLTFAGKYFKTKKRDILYVGDALFKGGNDHPIIGSGADWIRVKSPKETKKIIRSLIS